MNPYPRALVAQLRMLCADWNAAKNHDYNRWDVFNVPADPISATADAFLTVGIEKNDATGYFNCDKEAYDWVGDQDGEIHKLAIKIHDLADALRLAEWGDKDCRTPPAAHLKKYVHDIPENVPAAALLNVTLNFGDTVEAVDLKVNDICYDNASEILDFIVDVQPRDPIVRLPAAPWKLYLYSKYQYGEWKEAKDAGALYPLEHIDFDNDPDFSRGVLADLVETLRVADKCFGTGCVGVIALRETFEVRDPEA